MGALAGSVAREEVLKFWISRGSYIVEWEMNSYVLFVLIKSQCYHYGFEPCSTLNSISALLVNELSSDSLLFPLSSLAKGILGSINTTS